MAKTILITGASSGLGAGMAHEFAAKGYNLAICARRLDKTQYSKIEANGASRTVCICRAVPTNAITASRRFF